MWVPAARPASRWSSCSRDVSAEAVSSLTAQGGPTATGASIKVTARACGRWVRQRWLVGGRVIWRDSLCRWVKGVVRGGSSKEGRGEERRKERREERREVQERDNSRARGGQESRGETGGEEEGYNGEERKNLTSPPLLHHPCFFTTPGMWKSTHSLLPARPPCPAPQLLHYHHSNRSGYNLTPPPHTHLLP